MMVEYDQKIKSVKSDYTLCESSKDSDWWCEYDPLVEKTKLIGGLITLISVIIVQKEIF